MSSRWPTRRITSWSDGETSSGDRPARPSLKPWRRAFIDVLDEVYRSGQPFTGRRLSLPLHRSEGEEAERRFFNLVYQPLMDARGSVAGIFCEGHDVTEEVRAEGSVRDEAEQRAAQAKLFDTALSAIEDFAYTFDRAGRFTYANKPLVDLLGLEPHQVVGKRFPELPYPPELANRLQSELDEVVRTGRQVKGDTYYKSPTGKEGWYEYIFNPVLAANGAVASIAGSTRNVTVRQEQERRLTSLHESERQAREEAERAGRLKTSSWPRCRTSCARRCRRSSGGRICCAAAACLRSRSRRSATGSPETRGPRGSSSPTCST